MLSNCKLENGKNNHNYSRQILSFEKQKEAVFGKYTENW